MTTFTDFTSQETIQRVAPLEFDHAVYDYVRNAMVFTHRGVEVKVVPYAVLVGATMQPQQVFKGT